MCITHTHAHTDTNECAHTRALQYVHNCGWVVVVVAMWNRSGGLVVWIAAALALGGYN